MGPTPNQDGLWCCTSRAALRCSCCCGCCCCCCTAAPNATGTIPPTQKKHTYYSTGDAAPPPPHTHPDPACELCKPQLNSCTGAVKCAHQHPPACQPTNQPTYSRLQSGTFTPATHTQSLHRLTQLPVPALPWQPSQSLQCWRPQPGSHQTPWRQRRRPRRCPCVGRRSSERLRQDRCRVRSVLSRALCVCVGGGGPSWKRAPTE